MPGKFTFYAAGQLIQIVDAGWVPNEGHIAGETLTRASQMPGGYSNKVKLKDSYIWYNGAWRSFNGVPRVTDPSIHGNTWISFWEDRIWDKACA